MRAQSAKRRKEQAERARVRQIVLERDRGCRAARLRPDPDGPECHPWPTRCRSPFFDRPRLEVHEIVSRGQWPAGYLEPSNCLALCQVHHDWVTDNPAAAKALGLRKARDLTTGVDVVTDRA